MDYDSCRSLPAMFFAQAARLGDKPFLWAKRDGRYRAVSWGETARDVRRLALGLRALGIGRGERIGLVSENRPEWIIADLAIMTATAIPAITCGNHRRPGLIEDALEILDGEMLVPWRIARRAGRDRRRRRMGVCGAHRFIPNH